MSEDRITKVILSNMCMLYKDDEYLIINRTKSDWPGLSFPGGHVEDGETLEESIIREMKEETGLDIKNPRLVGIKDWPWGNNVRYFALLYSDNLSTHSPSIKICPLSGGKTTEIKFINVDLPEPLPPMIVTNSPSLICKEILSRAIRVSSSLPVILNVSFLYNFLFDKRK